KVQKEWPAATRASSGHPLTLAQASSSHQGPTLLPNLGAVEVEETANPGDRPRVSPRQCREIDRSRHMNRPRHPRSPRPHGIYKGKDSSEPIPNDSAGQFSDEVFERGVECTVLRNDKDDGLVLAYSHIPEEPNLISQAQVA